MSRESKATKEEIQRNRDEAYQNGWGDGYAEGFGKATEAAIAALPARGVGVKPLVWFEAELPSRGGGKYTADGYTLRRIEGLWLLDFAGNGKTAWRWVDLEAAKAAAQADYEARILAALAPTDAAHVNETPKSEHDAGNVLTDAAQAPAEDAHVKGETAGQMLERLGMDGAKWAAEFRTTALRLGYSDMDEGWLIGWFCNAIMAGYDRSAAQAREAAIRECADALRKVIDYAAFAGADPDEVEDEAINSYADYLLTLIGEAHDQRE